MPGNGRPKKLTPVMEQDILDKLRKGLARSAIETMYELPPNQIAVWMRVNNRRFRDFSKAVCLAEAEPEVKCLKAIMDNIDKDQKLAKWFLSVRYPFRYSEYDQHKVALEKRKLEAEIKRIEAEIAKGVPSSGPQINITVSDYKEVDTDPEPVRVPVAEMKAKLEGSN